MDQGHNSNQGDVQGREGDVGQGIDEPMEEINEVAPMEGMTGDATVEVNGAAAVNVVNGAGVNSAETQQPAALPINAPLPPLPTTRGRRPNANGNRRTSPVWLDFNPLPNEPEPIAACKHCHKRYHYDSKAHGTSSMLLHSKTCLQKPSNMLYDPRQSNLVSGKGGLLVAFSTGGRILDTYRSSLSPEMVEALICTQNWLKPSIIDFKDLNLSEEYELLESVVAEIGQVLNGVDVGPAGPAAGVAPATGL